MTTEKIAFQDPFRKKKLVHRESKRVLVHFLLFTLIGAILLGAGIFGRGELKKIITSSSSTVRQQVLTYKLDAVVNDMRSTVLRTLDIQENDKDKNNQKIITNLVSNSFRTNLQEMLINQEPADTIAVYIVDTMTARATQRLSGSDEAVQTLKARVEETLAEERDDLIAEAAMMVNGAEESINSADGTRAALKDINPKPDNYFFIYYSRLLLLIGGIVLAFGLFCGAVHFFAPQEMREKTAAYLEPLDYLLPFFFGVVVFTLYPMVRVFIMAFQERYKLTGEFVGWGIGNFRDVLFGINTKFPQALGNTFIYVLLTVPISVALSIILAYLLNQKIKLRALFQTAYFLPMVTSAVAVGMVWKFMFNGDYGIINWLLNQFGVDKIAWLTKPQYSMAVMVIYGIWDSLPFTIILMISGLQNIDEHFYTVAKVDGAKSKRIFFRITIPLLAPTIGLVLIINSISAFKVYNSVIVLFSGYPGPMYNMYTVVYYIYEMINSSLEYGRAAAASLVLFAVILAFTMVQRFIQRKWTYD